MGNRNNDAFDDDDGFLRDDDDFQFDDLDDNANMDDGFLDNLDEDPIILDDEGNDPNTTERERTNPIFLILAAIFIIILLGGIGLIVFLISTGGQANELDITRTAIADANSTVLAQQALTQTQSAVNVGLTATAALFTPTPTVTLTPSPTPVDFTATAIAESTNSALAIAGTSTTIALLNAEVANQTATAIALATGDGSGGGDATPTQEGGNNVVTPISGNAVDQTATALAGILVAIDPTQGSNQGGILATATMTLPINGTGGGNGQLPNTGLFDDLNTGAMSTLAIVAFGLVGVIVMARRTRKKI